MNSVCSAVGSKALRTSLLHSPSRLAARGHLRPPRCQCLRLVGQWLAECELFVIENRPDQPLRPTRIGLRAIGGSAAALIPWSAVLNQ